MLATIPAEFGRVIPQPLVRCSQCGRQTMEIEKQDDEPLCSVCRINDRAVGMSFAKEAVRELVVPVELQHLAPPRFGRGSGEIESCELVLAMRHEASVDRDARLCRRLTWGFFVLGGLLLMATAAATR